MEVKAVYVSHVFEESSCCICGRVGFEQFLKITDNFIKYKSTLISFMEVIIRTLDYEVSFKTSNAS